MVINPCRVKCFAAVACRQISPGHFSGNAVKSPEKPGFFPDFMMFSGAACGHAGTHAIFFSAASILLHQPVTTIQATTATPLANYSILLRSSIQFVHLETFKCCTLMCMSGIAKPESEVTPVWTPESRWRWLETVGDGCRDNPRE